MLVRREDHESPLGRWRTYRWAPQPAEPVARFVELVWYFDGALTLLRERNFPNGCYDLIVQFDVPHRPIVGEPYADRFPSICFGGMNASPYIIEAPPGRIRVLGVVLRPLGAYAVLGLPLVGLAGYTSDLRSLLGIEANRLEARLHAAPQGSERVALTVRWLRARLARVREFDTAVAWAAERIDAGPAGSIASLR
jgi:hypothetical protein